MATPVVTVAAGGLPVVDVTATFPKLGLPVTEALNGRGIAVTKVAANGLPVTFKAVGNEWPFPPNPPPTSGGGAASAETTAWLARAPGLDAAHIAADTAFIDGLVADGIWSKFDVIRVFATQTSAAALLNMVSASYPGVIHGSPVFTADRGFTGVDTSTTVWIGSGFNPSTAGGKYTQNSAHLSSWIISNTGSTQPGFGYANSGSTNVAYIWVRFVSDGNSYNRINVAGVGNGNVPAAYTGHFVGNRSGPSQLDYYRNGVSYFTNGVTGSLALLNLEFYEIALNNNGVADGAANQVAMDTIGSSLTAAEWALFYARARTRMTAVGVP
jgi:hypothetical protein